MGLKTLLKDICDNRDYYKKVSTGKRGMSAADESWIESNGGAVGKIFTYCVRHLVNKK